MSRRQPRTDEHAARRAGRGAILAALSVAATTAIVAAQTKPSPRSYTPPKTAWGEPDLRGTYTSDNFIGVPFERPAQYGDRQMLTDAEFEAKEKANEEQVAKDLSEKPESKFEEDEAANNAPRHWLERGTKLSHATSLVIDPPNGRLPALTPAGQARAALGRARFFRQNDAAEFHSYYDRCITRGVISSILPAIYGNGTRILQGPGYVVIQNEMIHEDRVIPTGSSAPRLGKNIHLYMGDPRGHWEANTLVVDSTNFTDKVGVGGGGQPSRNLHLIEKFTRTAQDTIHYEFTVDDPDTYAAKWTAALDLTGKPGYEIYEYACHEGNYGLRNMLSASRADDRATQSSPRLQQ
ncbi:MAG TPA: hypothetical protein VN628_16345 [Vicinamibacterales bacterium]|nr:hypothetical protein [Vicinamibacterales bacterium]